jgi:hypothetical protein
MGLHDVRPRIEPEPPDLFQKHHTGHGLAGIEQQHFKETIFQRQKVDFIASPEDGSVQSVHQQVAAPEPYGLGFFALSTSPKRLDAGVQLLEREGFDQIVICAAFEASHTIRNGSKGGDKQDRGVDTAGPESPDEGLAIQLRQKSVENHDVKWRGC